MKKTAFYIWFIVFILAFSSCSFSEKTEKLSNNEEYEKLIGKWKVIKSNFFPFEHPSSCEKIGLNSIFEFDEYGVLKIYEDDQAKQNCNAYQKFWIDGKELIIFENDVGFLYEILKLASDSLIIKSEIVPAYLLKEDDIKTAEKLEGGDVKFIRENGIVIRLKKLKTSDNKI